ncbi:hypothetical protein BBP40_005304 [Aspergillus hancockii]|nr:hypothetical protein BBP40_005304 [Aspergillus hancockii]
MSTVRSSLVPVAKYDFTEVEEIYPALLKIRCPAPSVNPQFTQNHLELFNQLARELNVSEKAFANAYQLGTGYGDLAVVLVVLEPSDKADPYSWSPIKVYVSHRRVSPYLFVRNPHIISGLKCAPPISD